MSYLEVFSVAYNKIQDQGFSLVLDLLLGQTPLRVLDVAGCFITNYSVQNLRGILECTPNLSPRKKHGSVTGSGTSTRKSSISKVRHNSQQGFSAPALQRLATKRRLSTNSTTAPSSSHAGEDDSSGNDTPVVMLKNQGRSISSFFAKMDQAAAAATAAIAAYNGSSNGNSGVNGTGSAANSPSHREVSRSATLTTGNTPTMAATIRLEHVFLQGALISQSIWSELRELMVQSVCCLDMQEPHRGIKDIAVYKLESLGVRIPPS